MKKLISILLVFSMFLPSAVVIAADVDLQEIEITDVSSNELFEITEELTEDKETKYASHLASVNPESPVLSGEFADGLKETEETYVDINGKPVTLPASFSGAADYLKESDGYSGLVFAGSKYYNCGFIQFTDKNKDSCYTACFDYQNNTAYRLPQGYEMSRFGNSGDAYLYEVEGETVKKAYKIKLKKYPVIRVLLKSTKIAMDTVPVIENDRVLVPMRAVFENLEAEVSWDDTTKTVTAKKDDTTISLTIDSMTADKNGEKVELEAPARIIDGRTLVPLRFVADCFFVETTWDEETRKVTLKKGADYYINCGYEDHGYVSPALSSLETYPDYIKEEVEKSVAEIKSHQNEDTITLAFITDLHYATSENHNIRMQRTVNAYKEIAKKVPVDKVILGGDFTNEGCKEYKTGTYNELRQHFEGIDYLPVNGNHDDGSIWDYKYILSDKPVNHFTHSELYDLFYDHVPSLGAQFNANAEEGTTLYYMVNDEKTKTRYIFLDSGDLPYIVNDDGKLKYQPQWDYAMSQEQIDWLTGTALKFDEEGWSAVITTHYVTYPSTAVEKISKRRRMRVLTDILDAYKNGGHINADYYEDELKNHVDVDFSKYTRGDVIAVLAGDVHKDILQKSTAGIPHIFTANAVMYMSTSASAVPRADGDASEVLFDVITIDKKTRKIYITRVGAGESRETDY